MIIDKQLHAVVARSTFRSQNVQSTIAEHCHHCQMHALRDTHLQVKSVKNYRIRTTFELHMSKKCTPLWREAHLQVKSVLKTEDLGALFDLGERKDRCCHMEPSFRQIPTQTTDRQIDS